MSLDVAQLGKEMLGAMNGVLQDDWPEIRAYAESESRKMAEALVMVETLVAQGSINAEQARLHVQMQKNAARMVLLAIEGLGVLMAEKAINAALAVVRDTVNSALRFTLL